jgi:hypothetical protein
LAIGLLHLRRRDTRSSRAAFFSHCAAFLGGAIEVDAGSPSHVVKAVAGAGGLDAGEVPGCSR